MIAELVGIIVGGLASVTVIYFATLSSRNGTLARREHGRLPERRPDYMDPLGHLDRLAEPETGCAHSIRAVSVVPYAHNAPEAWICPDCSEVVDEPVALGPYRRDMPDAAPVPSTPPPRTIATGSGRIDGSRITADTIHATPIMSSPEAQREAEAQLAAALRRSEASPLGPGWRRERDGSITQLETPTPTRLTARDYAVAEGKVLDEVEFEEVRSLDGSVRIRLRARTR